jgi:hypothetical protein
MAPTTHLLMHELVHISLTKLYLIVIFYERTNSPKAQGLVGLNQTGELFGSRTA